MIYSNRIYKLMPYNSFGEINLSLIVKNWITLNGSMLLKILITIILWIMPLHIHLQVQNNFVLL